MCGIAGIYTPSDTGIEKTRVENAIRSLVHRGPDLQRFVIQNKCTLAHARLSIIDLSDAASQPFVDYSGRYTIVFNGEIFNFLTIKKQLIKSGCSFRTNSDTEVLLQLFIQKGLKFFDELNGFFAFAIYDAQKHELILARDRFGIKPLYFTNQNGNYLFGSEWRAIHTLSNLSEINRKALCIFFQLGYIPAPYSMTEQIQKLEPGHYLHITSNGAEKVMYYQISPKPHTSKTLNYQDACKKLYHLVHDAVEMRLISDVPLGAFLSGGIDSSVIVAAATKFTPFLHTFSVGYKNHPYFDETHYANLVSKKLSTNHHVFSLSNDDLKEGMFDFLHHVDEPFADSSAIPVNLLCREVKKQVTVALSGDAGDELFAGYNKHAAEYRVLHGGWKNKAIQLITPFLKHLPASRDSRLGNLFRQISRYTDGLSMPPINRYLRWASVVDHSFPHSVLHSNFYENKPIHDLLQDVTSHFKTPHSIHDVLIADMKLVLPNDMLHKVDSMSMRNSLEVRVPFLDYRIVEFAFQIPDTYKIDSRRRKKILVDAFRHELPEELFNRKKQGFEMPLRSMLIEEWNQLGNILDKDKLNTHGIFDIKTVEKTVKQLFSSRPEDAHFKIWALIVFQKWFDKYHSHS